MIKIFCDFQNFLSEQIATISEFTESVYKEKSSSFIAKTYRINSSEHFEEILSNVHKEYFDANHYCYAYRLPNNKINYSDDGEPHNTAGVRILNAIDYHNLSFIAIIVIRYFGGTKLGVGALGKAYFTAANMVLEKAELINLFLCQRVNVEINFSHINNLHQLIKTHQIIIEKSSYTTNACYTLLIKRSCLEKFKVDFQNKFLSFAELMITKDFFYIQL